MKRTPLQRKSPLRRTPQKKKSRTPDKYRYGRPRKENGNAFSRETKERVRAIQFGRCALCDSQLFAFHHRRMRSQGGSGVIENCLGLCLEHHTLVHDRVAWAYRHGLLVKSTRRPQEVPSFLCCLVDCDSDHTGQ